MHRVFNKSVAKKLKRFRTKIISLSSVLVIAINGLAIATPLFLTHAADAISPANEYVNASTVPTAVIVVASQRPVQLSVMHWARPTTAQLYT